MNYTIVYDDVVVGRIGLHHINLLHKNASIGYWIAKDSEGKGIMLRSCTALINHGFSELNLNRMDIRAATKNVRSRAVAERLGFGKEGILREAELVNNQFQDLVLYSILRKEWQRATDR